MLECAVADRLDLLVLVFDGATARFFKGDAQSGWRPSAEMHSDLHRFARETGTDKGGRRFSLTGRHAMEPRHDPHKEEKHDFVQRLVKTLDTAYDQRAFKRLIVVAPERSLGEFRKLASSRLMKLVVREVPKELTQYTDHELWERLRSYLSEAIEAR
jgi:protein required for attachment to host cells